MPYEIHKNGDEWCVYKMIDDSQEQIGCHDSETKAKAQLTALNINEYGERVEGELPVRMINDVEGVIEGYIAIWGNPDETDSYNTWFDKANPPDMDLDLLPIALRYEHGMDNRVGKERIGEITDIWFDEVGIAFRGILDKTGKYFSRIVSEIKHGTAHGRLCTSSGSQDYLTEFREDGSFKIWPLSELSLTAYPAEKRMPQVELIRSEHDTNIVGTPTNKTLADDKHQTNNLTVIDNTERNDAPGINGEFRMLEQLQQLLAQLPADATLDQVIAAILNMGITIEDLQAAVDMLKTPEESEGEEAPRSDLTDNERLVAAIGKVIAAKEAQQTVEANRSLKAQNAALRASMALQNVNTQRSAAPVAQPIRGDTTAQSNQHVNVSEPARFAHLSASDMILGLRVFPHLNNDTQYMRGIARRIQEDIEIQNQGKRTVWKNRADFNAVRSAFPYRADELMATNISGQGQQWVGVYYDTQIWNVIRQNRVFSVLVDNGLREQQVPDGATSTVISLEGADSTWYAAAEANDVDATGRPAVTMGAPSYIGTNNVTVTPGKLATRVLISTELVEDSVIPVLNQLQMQLEESSANIVEYIFLNGDTATGASTNINLIDDTPATGLSAPAYLNSNGALKLALVTNTANKRPGTTLSSADFLATKDLIDGTLTADPRNICYIMDNRTGSAALQMVDVKTRDIFTPATLEDGALPRIWGSPVLTSGQMALANTAGKISVTAGNNVKGRLLAVVPKYWALAWKRQVIVKTEEDIESDTRKIVVSMRLAFIARTNEASAVTYNLSV